MLPGLGPELTWHGSIHGGVAGHFLHGVAPSAVTYTSIGPAASLALARSRCCSALALVPLPSVLLLALLPSLLLLLALLLYSCVCCCYTSSRSCSPSSPCSCYLRCCYTTSCPGSRTRCCYCFTATSAFSFDSKIQFRQQNSVSTVKFSFDSYIQVRQLSSEMSCDVFYI